MAQTLFYRRNELKPRSISMSSSTHDLTPELHLGITFDALFVGGTIAAVLVNYLLTKLNASHSCGNERNQIHYNCILALPFEAPLKRGQPTSPSCNFSSTDSTSAVIRCQLETLSFKYYARNFFCLLDPKSQITKFAIVGYRTGLSFLQI